MFLADTTYNPSEKTKVQFQVGPWVPPASNDTPSGTDTGTDTGTESGTAEQSGSGDSGTTTPAASSGTKGNDGTAFGAGASASVVDKAIRSLKSDADPKGTKYAPLQLKSTKQTGKDIYLSWKKVNKAKKYVLYAGLCGKKNKMKKLATFTGAGCVAKNAKKNCYYKFVVVALDSKNKVVSTSRIVHVTVRGGKVGNHKSVTVKIKSGKKKKTVKAVTVKRKKTVKLIASAQAYSKKATVKKHRAICYESANTRIATVSKKGVVKGVKKGKTKIYAYAQNGVCIIINVTVK